jgi:hypothetical protein
VSSSTGTISSSAWTLRQYQEQVLPMKFALPSYGSRGDVVALFLGQGWQY